MPTINTVNSITPIINTNEEQNSEDRRLAKRMQQQRLNQNRQNEELSEKTTQYFFTDNDNSTGDFIPLLNQNKSIMAETIIDKNLTSIYDKYVNINNAQYIKQYLVKEELDELFDLFEDKELYKKSIESLINEISSCADGMELVILEKFTNTNLANKALIYIALSYILDMLSQTKLKEKFQKKLRSLLSQYESQESNFLFSFFALSNDKKLNQNGKLNNLTKLVEISCGETKLNEINNVVDFIDKNLDGKFEHLISTYMKLRARQLFELRQINSESRHLLIELLQTERYLILVNSLFLKISMLRNNLKHIHLLLTLNNGIAIKKSIDFLQLNQITELNLMNLIRGWSIDNYNKNNFISFLNNLRKFIIELPNELFVNQQKGKKKISEDIKFLLQESSNREEEMLQQQLK